MQPPRPHGTDDADTSRDEYPRAAACHETAWRRKPFHLPPLFSCLTTGIMGGTRTGGRLTDSNKGRGEYAVRQVHRGIFGIHDN